MANCANTDAFQELYPPPVIQVGFSYLPHDAVSGSSLRDLSSGPRRFSSICIVALRAHVGVSSLIRAYLCTCGVFSAISNLYDRGSEVQGVFYLRYRYVAGSEIDSGLTLRDTEAYIYRCDR
ncbi:hypothetical protein Trydic_g10276 [Trypoxylus dichotomus]